MTVNASAKGLQRSDARAGRERSRPSRHRAMRGAALPLVLWLITLLVAMVGSFALSARTEMLQGRILADGSQAKEIARAGLEYAMQRVASPIPQSRWVGDGRPYRWSFADAAVEIRIVDESGKVDINQANVTLLAALLREVGVDSPVALELAGAMVDWRDSDALLQVSGGAEDPAYRAMGLPYGAKDASFQSLGELHQVAGMTPDVVARLMPYVTLASGLSQPDAQFAPAPVLAAMGLDAMPAGRKAAPAGAGGGSGTYSIESSVTMANGREAVLRATVRNGGSPDGSAYIVIGWGTGAR